MENPRTTAGEIILSGGVSKHDVIAFDATIGLDEVAAIKVAETERELIAIQETLSKKSDELQKKYGEVSAKLGPEMIKDARRTHPKLKRLEALVSEIFGKDGRVQVQFNNADQVLVSIGGQHFLKVSGKASGAIRKEMTELTASIGECNEQLVKAKKGLCMLPTVERDAKARIARYRLGKTTDGKALLAHLDKGKQPLTMPSA